MVSTSAWVRRCAAPFVWALAALFAVPVVAAPAPGAAPAKNLILIIGDGLGAAHLPLARDVVERPLVLDSLLVGAVSTAAMDSRVTDSAASATALACGARTNNGVVGMDPAGRAVRTIVEAAAAAGRSTGLVTTSRITHATPACFVAHVRDRWMEDEIAAQIAVSGVDVALGGGRRHFLPKPRGRREDGRDLEAAWKGAGGVVVTDRAALRGAPADRPLLGLFNDSHMSYVPDRTPAEPTLPEMTRVALERLARNPRGFFLMVEAARIDHAAHGNDPATVVREVIELDEAVAAALAFARRTPGTLVVVTADHETGGLSLGRAVDGESIYDWSPAVLRGVTRSAIAMAQRIEGSAAPAAVLAEDAGITDLAPAEAEAIRRAGNDRREELIGEAISRRARIGWTTHGHTGMDVGLWAFGPGADRLRGTRHNDALGRALFALIGLEAGAADGPGDRATSRGRR